MGTNITGIGNANAIGFKSRVTGGAYFPPELKDALVGVWSAYGKSNDSTDRNIIKNKIKDKGGDFVISNAAFKLNSGFGKYEVDFTSWIQTDGVIASSDKVQNSIIGRFLYFNTVNKKEDVPSFKVNITLGQQSKLQYNYIKEDGTTTYIVYSESGIYTIPASYFSKYTGGNAWFGFYQIEGTSIIEQIPSFEGAFVTDGIDDLITSTKTVQEMLGGSNEITVVSMIHQIGFISSRNYARNNYFIQGNDFLTNTISAIGKIGIYGYKGNLSNIAIVNDILGDKKDYSVDKANPANIDSVFSVNGTHSSAQLSQVAWYWTFIAKRVLTEDEINLVIEKYNLDRPGEIVKPDVYYDIKRQKITNDNHSAFDDKLIDYSGNGYDAKLYNFGWKEDSGIGKYETDFTDWKKSFKVTSFDSESIKFTSDVSWVLLYHPSSIGEDIPSFKVRIKLYGKGTLYYNYITQEGKYTNVAVKSEIFETPICYNTKYTGEKGVNVGFTLGVTSGECSGTITQIPEYENALVLDGVDDYGKVTGLPILKDYTVAADYIRTFAKENAQDSPILSKSKVAGSGAFLFNYLNADSITNSYSFGTNNILKEINDSERKIYYLSKYASDGHNVNAGSAVDYDTMWLGTYRDNTSNFFTGALYFAMLFPYSLSEFLLERQIKKARAGTLYPNQVEFRPIIPEDENITKIDYFVVNSGTWTIIKPGDYVDVGARIVFNIYTKLPYKVAGVSSTSFTGMSIRPSTGLNIFDVQGYIKDKTPQKIKLTLAVNEDIIQWNPTISANIPDSYDAVTEWFANGWETKIAVGDWIKKSDRIFFKLKLKEPLHEIGKVTFGGSECQATKASNWSESNNLWEIVTYSSVGDLSQVFNVQVDEYIRFEDIVQPYPILLRFNDENGNGVSWGGKFRVGSTITRIGSIADPESNLLNGLYSISGLSLNGKAVTSSTSIVEKQMVFKTTATWLLDNSKPKCILSPSRLRIPNSSYKLLGYIPDISGHGNHGKINNSAYAGMSGVNGYPVVFGANKTWANESNGYVTSITSNTIHITNVLNAGLALLYSYVKYNGNLQNIKEIPPFKIEIKGLEGRSKFIYKYLATSDATKETNLYLGNGTHELPKSFLPTEALINNAVVGFSISPIEEGVTNFLSDITIKVLPKYEGAYCLDGVDDFVTIPTTVGGKQVLMKVNWNSSNSALLYDQRGYNNEFAIYNGSADSDGNPIPAYQGRNNGQTYIDGILNSNIKVSELRAITHNITITNELSAGVNKFSPVIGSNRVHNAYFTNMALYDFMLFDEISTEAKIKELNTYIGITPKVTLPNYYWDNYGKKNTDANRGHVDEQVSLQKTGTSVNPLENFNISYEGMSGYNGYPVVFGASKTWESLSGVYGYTSNVTNTTIHVTHAEHAGNGLLFSYVKKDGALANIKEIPAFRVTIGGLEGNSKFGYRYLATEDATEETLVYLGNGTHELAKSFAPTEALLDLTRNVWVGIFITPMIEGEVVFDCDITIEVLPEYENGLAYDGISDFSQNTEIEVVEDFTFLVKGSLLKGLTGSGGCIARKGDKNHYDTGGYAFIYCFDSPIESYRNSYYSFGKSFVPSKEIVAPPLIGYMTKTNVNGETTTFGTNSDIKGIIFGNWSSGYMNMVIYKSIFYTKTISLLEINFLKNLMEKDEIIDINHPIFISNTEDESNTSQDT